MRNAYKASVGKSETRPPATTVLGWEDNIKIDLRKYDCRLWIGFMWLRIGTNGELL
jgi:hypothetical protein